MSEYIYLEDKWDLVTKGLFLKETKDAPGKYIFRLAETFGVQVEPK